MSNLKRKDVVMRKLTKEGLLGYLKAVFPKSKIVEIKDGICVFNCSISNNNSKYFRGYDWVHNNHGNLIILLITRRVILK